MITYICGSVIKYTQFPDEFWNDIDKLMADGDEILLGNSDFDHRVYGRCRNKQYENVSVTRETPNRKRSLSQIECSLPSYVCMLRKCGYMITVWDGESQEALINVLLLLSLHKKCRMYYLPSNKCVEIASVGELEPYVQKREGWTVSDMEEVLRTCGFEDEMTACMLKDGVLSETLITEIISRAPVSVNRKLEMLQKLQKKNGLNHEAFSKISPFIEKGFDIELIKQEILEIFSFGAYISKGISDINLAKNWLKNGKHRLFAERYDTDEFNVKSDLIGEFRFLDDVMKRIEHEDLVETSVVDRWYRLEVWTEDYGSWGSEATHDYNYYIFKGEICWFEMLREEKDENGTVSFMPDNKDFFGGNLVLNLPVPYRHGDIVNIDCTPFGPPFHALIIEAGNLTDCGMPQVLFKVPFTDRWSVSSLKHKQFYKDSEKHHYEPVLSPLYRLRTVTEDELEKHDELLIRISKELKDGETGSAFVKALNDPAGDGISAEEVLKIWESASKRN